MKAAEIAAKAADLVGGDREKEHGDKRVNFDNIARLWNAWFIMNHGLAGQLTGADVAKLMTLLKIARMESGEFNLDDAIDACGYAAIAGELSTPTETLIEGFRCRHGVGIRERCSICEELTAPKTRR